MRTPTPDKDAPLSTASRPKDQNQGSAVYANYFRDQLTIQSWMSWGAIIQSLVLAYAPIPKHWAVAPAVAWVGYCTLHALVSASTYKPADYGQFTTKFSAKFEKDPQSSGSVCVLLHKFRCYHPLGMLASKQTELLHKLNAMNSTLREKAEEFGYLGGNYYLGAAENASNNEILMVYYFRDYECVTRFAHSEVHRDGWKWWSENLQGLGHMGISHEIYEAPAGSWETLSINFRPSGLTATSFAGINDLGEKKWMSPIVNASKGKYLTSAGRMGHGTGEEHSLYDHAMQANERYSEQHVL